MATLKGTTAIAETKTGQDALHENPSLAMIGLLIVVMIIGYEWLVSGLTKIVNGDFTSGLADELADKLADAPSWYASFLKGAVIPNASTFGYLIEFGEVLIGLTFIFGSLLWLFAWKRIPNPIRETVLLLTAAAAIGGIFLALNFHFANGLTHPWLLPKDSFDEGVDFDSFLAVMNFLIATTYVLFFNRFRQEEADVVAALPGTKEAERYTEKPLAKGN